MNNLKRMKNCPVGLQGRLNWMPGYKYDAIATRVLIRPE